MRLFLFIGLLCSICSISSAQFRETFDELELTAYPQSNLYTAYCADLPQGWTEHDIDQIPLFYIIGARMEGRAFKASIQETNGVKDTVAIAWSTFASGGTADDWLITPKLSIPSLTDAQKAFMFWDHRTYSTDELAYEVRISTGGNSPEDFTTVLWTAPTGSYGLTDFTFNDLELSAYEGQEVYLAYHYYATSEGFGSKLLLDDFQLKVIEDHDIAVKSLSALRYQKSTEAQSIGIELFNWGLPITQFDAVLSDGINTSTMTVTNVNIPRFGKYTFNHTTEFSNNTAGEYPISIAIENINGTNEVDTDVSNNSLETKISVVSNNPVRNVVLEELTGTWCPACPLGIVAIDSVSHYIPDGTFIPIAVHAQVNDPMTVPEYWLEINLNAAPSCQLDRHPYFGQLDMGPQITYQDVLAKKDYVTPAEVDQSLFYDESSGNLSIKCSATFHTDISTELRFASVITQDSLTGTTSEWGQSNAYSGNSQPLGGFESLPNPVPPSQMVHNHAARALLGGFHGQPNSLTSPIQNGETHPYTFNFQVPDTVDVYKLHVVTFVIDHGTGEILNAISSKLDKMSSTSSILPPNKNNFDFTVYPSPLHASAQNLNVLINSKTSQAYLLMIHSMDGKLVYSKELGPVSSAKVDLPAHIKAGAYHISLGTAQETKVQQLIIIE